MIKILMLFLILTNFALAKKKKVKVKVKYRSHTQFDFAGDQVSGKIKGAGVFYIFQRKRSKGHQVITPPLNFQWHKQVNIATVKDSIKK